MKHFLTATVFAFFCSSIMCGQNVPVQNIETTVMDRITDNMRQYPQEKVYIQTDKPYYSAGDTLWFKAYLVHASLHTPLHYSRYIYVEIINDLSQVMFRERVRPENDQYYCQIPLKAEITPGHYKLRAYTNYMRNLPEDYFFSKEFFIGNAIKSEGDDSESGGGLQGNKPDRAKDRQRKWSASDASYAVQFFPEGGHLIVGVSQNVAFKAIARDGLGCNIHGRIVDQDGNELTTFQSSWLGMGTVGLFTEAGKRYRAICENEMGEEYTFDLPAATDSTYSLAANLRNNILRISVLSPSGQPLQDSLYLMVALRGVPLYSTPVNASAPQVAVPTKSIPAGVLQLMLFNDLGEVVSERLVFNRSQSKVKVDMTFDKPSYSKRERVNATLRVTDMQGNPIQGDISLAVTDDRYIRNDSNALTIESCLLLSSELRGNIEQPGSYFGNSDKRSDINLDLLMLTQGWRRYDLPSIMRGIPQKFDSYEMEVGSAICGRLQTYPIRRAVPNVSISIFNSQNGYADAVNTDNSGRFCFEGFEFADSTTFFVQANKKEGQILELSIKAPEFPQVELPVIVPREDVMDQAMLQFLNKSREKYYYENGNMIINLDEVAVTARAVDNLRQDRGAMYTDPSYSFDEAALEDMAGMTLLDILLQAPGVTLDASGEGVLIRNATPAIYVDNMQMTMSDLRTISVFDVELIDILKDPTQTMLYQGGGNGVIAIYLKRGKKNQEIELGSHQKRVGYLGYTTAKEFYQPIYSVDKVRLNPTPDLRSTIYWQPNIVLDEKGEATVRFYTSDEKSTYSVIIEGMGSHGEIVRGVKSIKRQ